MIKGRIATVGMFDGFHRGHSCLVEQLNDAASKLNLSPAVITFPEHPLALIHPERVPQLLSTFEEKKSLIAERFPETEVISLPFSESLRAISGKSFLEMVKIRWNVRALMTGFNNHIGCDRLSGKELIAAGCGTGVEIIIAAEHPELTVSSTIVRNALASCRPDEATDLLGHPYTLAGTVTGGKQLGRRLGFPTANIVPDPCKLVPAPGVYACRATLSDGKIYPAMVNIGNRPTVDPGNSPISIEAHLIGLSDADLYGKPITLGFISYMRGEIKFGNLDELQNQLKADAETCLNILSD